MRNLYLLLCSIFVVATSCTPTPEERAEKLVSGCIKDYLTYPDSYESISTKVDSTKVNLSKITEILEITQEVASIDSKIKSTEYKIEFAQIDMDVYEPNSYFYSESDRRKYNKAKAEYEEYQLEIEQLNQKLHDKILDLKELTNTLYDDEVNGWFVTHRYRCMGDDGVQMPPQEMVFFCDMEFNSCQGWSSQQFDFISKIIKYIKESETDKELLEKFNDNNNFL